jgi:hypothetical protein
MPGWSLSPNYCLQPGIPAPLQPCGPYVLTKARVFAWSGL